MSATIIVHAFYLRKGAVCRAGPVGYAQWFPDSFGWAKEGGLPSGDFRAAGHLNRASDLGVKV
jgi:hypothetical protein